MGKYLATPIVVLIFVTLFTSAGIETGAPPYSADQREEQVITYALPFDFQDFGLLSGKSSYVDDQWKRAVAGTLYSRSTHNQRDYAENLALEDSLVVSSDGYDWTVDLKPNLKFADGEPLTSADVVFTYQVIISGKIADNKYSWISHYFDNNNSIVALDQDTVRFTLARHYAFARKLFDVPIISKTFYEDAYNQCVDDEMACDWNDDSRYYTLSAGPFFVKEINTDDNIVILQKNEHYWDNANVWADKLVFKTILHSSNAISELVQGTVDIIDRSYAFAIDTFQGNNDIRDPVVGDPVHQEISPNHLNPYWGTGEDIPGNGGTADARDALNVRKALSHIVNRQGFVDQILEGLGQPAATFMPSASLGWDSTLRAREYNVTRAKEYMEMAGFDFDTIDDADGDGIYGEDGEGYFFDITVLSPNTNPARNEWSASYVNELPKIGIKVKEHVSTSWDIIIQRTFGYGDGKPPSYADGGYDLFFSSRSWDLDFDPTGIITEAGLCDTGSCNNFYNYYNQTIEDQIAAYTSEVDFDTRLMRVKMLQQMLHDDIPVIPILYPQSHWAWSQYVQGIDELLISVTSQEWQFAKKSDWSSVGIGESFEFGNEYIKISDPVTFPAIPADNATTIISVTIDSNLVLDQVLLIYQVNSEGSIEIEMTSGDDKTYFASIPQLLGGDTVVYRIQATNSDGTVKETGNYSFVVSETGQSSSTTDSSTNSDDGASDTPTVEVPIINLPIFFSLVNISWLVGVTKRKQTSMPDR